MKKFWIRTASATVYVLLLVGTLYSGRLLDSPMWGVIIFGAFLLFVACGCTFELFRIFEKQGAKPNRVLGYLFAVVPLLLLIGFLVLDCSYGSYGSYGMVNLLVYFALFMMFLSFPITACAQLWKHSEQPFRDVAYTLMPALYVSVPLGLMLFSQYFFCDALMGCIALIWINDSFAYMGGSLIGKHKMWVRHSPGKSWEGTACGVLFAVLAGVFLGPVLYDSLSWYEWGVVALICAVIGTLGDLFESMLKRSVGLKDSGNIMPGHGGFLDRFDSLLMMMIPFVALILMMVK